MNNYQYLFEDYKDWSNMYHYWKGDDNNSYEYIKGIVNSKNYEVLYNIFSNRTYKINHLNSEVDFIDFLKDRLSKNIYNDILSSKDKRLMIKSENIKDFVFILFDKLFTPVINNFTGKIYRSVSIDDPKKFDTNYLGRCWTYDESILDNPWMFGDDDRYTIILTAKVESSNIDWLESLFLSLMYGNSEKEYRVINPEELNLINLKVIDNGE